MFKGFKRYNLNTIIIDIILFIISSIYIRVRIGKKFHGRLITETNRQKPLLTLTTPLLPKQFYTGNTNTWQGKFIDR